MAAAAALHDGLAAQALRIAAAKASMSANGGSLVLTGMCHRAERTNINRRFYSKALLDREVADYTSQLLLRGDALGELDHPDADSPYFKRINFKNASHRVLDLWWQGNDLHATVQVLNTRQGNLVRDTYLAGSNVGIASRGWATLRPDAHGVVHIGDDFMLITFDCVPRPAFERQMEPLETPCAALRTAQLLFARAHWWGSHALPPAWPWCMEQHSACVVRGQPMAPAVELMRHDAAFRGRARCLLLAHARLSRGEAGLGALPAQLVLHIIALAAAAEGHDCIGDFQAGFVPVPPQPQPRVRLCARPAQFPPLGADWAPLLHAVSEAAAAAEAAALDQAAAMDIDDDDLIVDVDAPACHCLELLGRACRGAAALHGSVSSAMRALRVALPASSADDEVDLLAEEEEWSEDDELAPAMLHLELEDSGDERSDAGDDWHAVEPGDEEL